MKKLLIFILIIATLVGVFMMPTGSATSVEEGDGSVEYVGDTLVSERIPGEWAWGEAFKIFTELRDAYYGINEDNDLNVRVVMNIAGEISIGEYDRGVFHDVWSDHVVNDPETDITYKDVYFTTISNGYQYGNGDIIEMDPDSPDFFAPLIIEIIDTYNLTDLEEAWKWRGHKYDEAARGYVKDEDPTIRFKNGKVANLMFITGGDDGHFLAEINFYYGDAVVALPTDLADKLRPEDQIPSFIGDIFSSLDYNVAKLMNRVAKSRVGNVVTFIMEAISLITENGILFFLIAIIMMLFAKTRKAGVLMFVSLAIGVVFTNMVLKGSIMRWRPFETNTIYYEFWKDVGCPGESGYSFPSGHTTAVMAAAVAFFISFKKKYSWLGILAVLAVGISRVYLMAHYTSDVIGGVLVGGVSGILAIFVTKLLYHIIGHYENSGFTKAILEKDVRFRRQKVEPVLATETADASEVEVAPVEEGKTADVWEDKLMTLIAEVRDLLKEGKGNEEEVAKALDDVERTIKADDKE